MEAREILDPSSGGPTLLGVSGLGLQRSVFLSGRPFFGTRREDGVFHNNREDKESVVG